MPTFECFCCGAMKPIQTTGGTGYGEFHGHRYCYECCALWDRQQMAVSSRYLLYLQGKEVTNWPGTLRFPARVQVGRHNIAGKRYDVWFTDDSGERWHGVQYGDNTQLLHCRKLYPSKSKSRRASC